MERMEELYSKTKEILSLLHKVDNRDTDRDMIITEINQLLEQRSRILKEIVPPYSDEEMAIGKSVTVLDEEIEANMLALFNRVREDYKQVKKKKDLGASYINPYGNMKTVDGMYLDNKL